VRLRHGFPPDGIIPSSVNNMLGSEENDSMKEPNAKTELPPRTMLRPSEVASFLRVSERTVYRWFELGLIEGVRINKSLRITRGSILTLLQRSGVGR
jgi:excisionase family DNA binding protein